MNYNSNNAYSSSNMNTINNFNFNLQLIPQGDKLSNNLVNNDLTGNTLTDDIDPSTVMNKTISNNYNANLIEDFWNIETAQTRNNRSNSNLTNTTTKNNRRLSISEYNFDNANYYEYENFEKNINLPKFNDLNNQQQFINLQQPTKQLMLTHHEISFDDDFQLDEIDIDMLDNDENQSDNDNDNDNDTEDITLSNNNSNNSSINPSSRRRVRDYFKFNLFNSSNSNSHQQQQPNDTATETLLNSNNSNNEQFLVKKKSFWNSKGNQFLKKRNKLKNEYPVSIIPNGMEFDGPTDIDLHFFNDESGINENINIEEISREDPIFNNLFNPLGSQKVSYSMETTSSINESIESTPIMTIAPSLVSNDTSGTMVEPIKTMNPFEQDNLNYYNNNNEQLSDEAIETPAKQQVIKKKKNNNTLPKTRGRKPSLVPDASKQFCCEYCDRRFKRQEHLKRHIRSLHICEKPFTCTICDKNFSRSDNLNQHIKTHPYSSNE